MVLPLLGLLGSAVTTAGRMGMMGAGGMARGAVTQGAGQLAGAAGKVAKTAGGPGAGKKVTNALINGPKRMYKIGLGVKKMAAKSMGVSLSIGAMLKQSQLFTGFLGAIFQVIGALVDAFLAPMMPTLFKLVAFMAKGVPKMQQMGQAIADWLGKFFKGGFENALTMLGDLAISAIKGILTLLWSIVWKLISTIFSKDFWFGLFKIVFTIYKVYFLTLWKLFKLYFTTIYVTIPKLIWGLLKEKIPWLQNVEDFVQDKIISPLTAVFSALGDSVKNGFSNAWQKFILLWDKFKVFLYKGIDKIPGVGMDKQILSAQAAVNKREQTMIDKGMDIKLTIYNNGNSETIDGTGGDIDITDAIIGGVVKVAGAISKVTSWFR